MELEVLDNLFDDEEVIVEVLGNIMAALVNDMEEDYDDRDIAVWAKIPVDVEGYRRFGDPTFAMHFRMPTYVFEALLNDIGNHLVENHRLQRVRTPLDVCLMMVLWILCNTSDTFRSTALHFHVSPGVLHFHYLYIIECLREMAPRFIQWPSRGGRQAIKAAFEDFSDYPGVVGCLDGTHTYIIAPLAEKRAYFNRHHSYSILTQAVCDYNLVVRDLYVGEPGSLHDSRVFRRSPLSSNQLENHELLDADEHILGDGAYICTDKVLTPYQDNGNLTQRQSRHNYLLSRCRSSVERCFGRCKGKFRRLKHFHSLNVEYAVDHIISCFVIHNYIILTGEPYPLVHDDGMNVEPVRALDFIEDEELDYDVEFPEVRLELDHPLLAAARVAGAANRNAIADQLFQEQ